MKKIISFFFVECPSFKIVYEDFFYEYLKLRDLISFLSSKKYYIYNFCMPYILFGN